MFAGLKLSDCSIELSYGDAHTLGGLDCLGVFMLGELPVGKRGKVLGMVAQNVCEFAHIVLS